MILEIADTGKGIPSVHFPKVFEPYFTTKTTGTGLGLPICKKIIEDHGGEISVMSEVGAGTTFSLSLPLKERGRAAVADNSI
jgi:signal transduction histidine kinase